MGIGVKCATLAVLRSTVRSRLAPPHHPPEILIYQAIHPDFGLLGLCRDNDRRFRLLQSALD